MPKYAKRVDQNQKEIVAKLRELGCSVFHLHTVGQGCPDLLVGIKNQSHLVEIKMPDGKFTPAQIEFMAQWKGSKVHRVSTIEEAVELINNLC
jgi:Holliday junction resolvase